MRYYTIKKFNKGLKLLTQRQNRWRNYTIKKFNKGLKPLHEVLLANGYEIDREKSTARNPVLKSNGGHKVIISLMPSGDYLYFNPNDDRDKGNIYNLAKNHGLDINEMLESYLRMPVDKKFNIKAKSEKENIKEIVDRFAKNL